MGPNKKVEIIEFIEFEHIILATEIDGRIRTVVVTAVEYCPGCPDTYWDPGEPPYVSGVEVRDRTTNELLCESWNHQTEQDDEETLAEEIFWAGVYQHCKDESDAAEFDINYDDEYPQ